MNCSKKNSVLKIFTKLVFALFILSIASLDYDTWNPFLIMCISGSYLLLFGYVNDWGGWIYE